MLAELYKEKNDWTAVRNEVVQQNVLQARTQNTLKRVCREIISRLRFLNDEALELLQIGSRQEQVYLLWLAVCLRYPFIGDFAVEVLYERFITMKTELEPQEFDAFFNKKAEWHPALEEIRESTRKKLRQILFKMLREADLLTAGNAIQAAMLTPRLIDVIGRHEQNALSFFPTFEQSR